MGQQQMLLMILATIVVGISIRVGFQIVDSQNMQQNRDQLMFQAQNIYAFAEQYATKSKGKQEVQGRTPISHCQGA